MREKEERKMVGIFLSPEGRKERTHKGQSLLEFPDEYVVLDIETTGLDPGFESIIELAGVKYKNGSEVERFQSLVNPGIEIEPFITELTGITNEMLADAPDIETALPDFLSFIGDWIIVGHNVNFDVNFLYDNADRLGLAPVANDFIDTMRLGRRLIKDIENHKLATLANYLKVDTSVEHRALADCLCAQKCFVAMESIAEKMGGIPKTSTEMYHKLSKSITPETDTFNPDSPIYGRAFAFTGKLDRMPRKDAMQCVINAGGICCDRITETTNYLVLGNNDFCKSIKDGKSNKHKKAESMKQAGKDIEIISEDVFYDMLEM